MRVLVDDNNIKEYQSAKRVTIENAIKDIEYSGIYRNDTDKLILSKLAETPGKYTALNLLNEVNKRKLVILYIDEIDASDVFEELLTTGSIDARHSFICFEIDYSTE